MTERAIEIMKIFEPLFGVLIGSGITFLGVYMTNKSREKASLRKEMLEVSRVIYHSISNIEKYLIGAQVAIKFKDESRLHEQTDGAMASLKDLHNHQYEKTIFLPETATSLIDRFLFTAAHANVSILSSEPTRRDKLNSELDKDLKELRDLKEQISVKLKEVIGVKL